MKFPTENERLFTTEDIRPAFPTQKISNPDKITRKVLTKPADQNTNTTLSTTRNEVMCEEEMETKGAGMKRTRPDILGEDTNIELDLPPVKQSNSTSEKDSQDKESISSSFPLFSEYPISSEILNNAADEDWYTDIHVLPAADHCHKNGIITEHLNATSVCEEHETPLPHDHEAHCYSKGKDCGTPINNINATVSPDGSSNGSSTESPPFLQPEVSIDQSPAAAANQEGTVKQVGIVAMSNRKGDATLLPKGNSNGLVSLKTAPPNSCINPQKLFNNDITPDKKVNKKDVHKTSSAVQCTLHFALFMCH